MTTFTALVDAEPLVRSWLALQFPFARVVTETPADLGDIVANGTPVIQVVRFGGSLRDIVLDDANLDVDYFDGPHSSLAARTNARAGAGQVRVALTRSLPGYATTGAAVQSVSEISAPRWVPYDNTDMRRYTAAYRITIRTTPS